MFENLTNVEENDIFGEIFNSNFYMNYNKRVSINWKKLMKDKFIKFYVKDLTLMKFTRGDENLENELV